MPKVKITGLPQMKKGGIHINPKNKGKFTATKKRTGKSTEELTHSKNPLTRKRAIFAQNAKKWKHEDGGYMYEGGGDVPTPIYNPSVPEVSVFDLTKQAMGGLMYKLGGPIKAGEGYVQNEPSEGFAYGGYSYKSGSPYATSDSPVPQRTSGLMNYLGYGKPRPFAMGGLMYEEGGPSEPINPPNVNPLLKDKEFPSNITRNNISSNLQTQINKIASNKSNDNPFQYIRNQKMNPQEWIKFNEAKGFKKVPVFDPKTGEEMASYSQYPDFYDPTKYATGQNIGFGGFRKIEDVNKPSVNYANDPTYKPFFSYDYKTPYVEQKKSTNTGPRVNVITPESEGWMPLDELRYTQQQSNPKQYGDLEYQSIASGTPGVMRRYMRPKQGTETWYKSQPGYVTGTKPWLDKAPVTSPDTKISTIGMAYGGKMPANILRSRLEAHMSPEEADNYLANYAEGGQAGTGILGNMTYNPRPWKYVAGGQLGPYPYSSYKTDLSEFKKGGIHIKPEKRGTFTAAATKHGMGVQEFARKVMANKEDYSPAMVKKANFARNAAKWHHAYGGYQPDLPKFYNGGPDNPPGFWDYAMSKSQVQKDPEDIRIEDPGLMEYALENPSYARGPKDRTNYTPTLMSEREANILGNLRRQLDLNRALNSYTGKPITTSLDDPNFGRTTMTEMNEPDIEFKAPFERPVDKKKDKKSGEAGDKSGMDWYYASQYAQQAFPELSYLLSQGMRYDIDPEYTYTPEQMSALEPLREVRSAERAAAMDLANKAGGSNYLAYRTALGAKSAAQRAKVLESIEQANIAARNQAKLTNLQYKQASDQATAQNKAQAMTNYYKTLERLGTIGATTGKDVRADEMDKYKWQYLPEMYPAMKLDPEQMALYNEVLRKKKKKTKTTKEETKKV